ncbi:SET domain-containing protein [Paracidobacterium acidisoli]|uniref:SET domain-containing protein n=1 Tax=Paracidobacterium acidisoli TaxID=2303751 RepID=A0A372ITE8_9BACT|nr:SET domain-containing protein-lysine N-methyltransferase [Paracidobacterium acidisoli]MBT9329464.1 SET domain-containing protein-lysine N-methyltransferase [Paracidobacterium acidisoli]
MGLIIRSSSIHAAGCYTTTAITKGSRVVEYTGPRITKELADEKYQSSPTTYLFGLGDGDFVIDGHGTAMFINHSCDPNCETGEVRGRVWVKAIRDIAPGEELTYDYFLYDGDETDPAYCNCGAEDCRKTMYSPDEVQRRERVANRATRKKQQGRTAAAGR